MNRLFVAKKPLFISSNSYLSAIKRRYGVKKAGFSGTLDPFAKGTLVVAFGQYSKLFSYLKLEPKEYIATLWLGADSKTLDIEGVERVKRTDKKSLEEIKSVFDSLVGTISYKPPIFSAKKIGGKRAYKEAREGRNLELKEINSKVYKLELLNYNHPFLSFKAVVSKGTYIRSIGKIIAQRLGQKGALSYLERVREGRFVYEGERELEPELFLDLPKNEYNGDFANVLDGKRLLKKDFLIDSNGNYFISKDGYLSILSINDEGVEYLVNRIDIC